jgi:hypothetical protein
MKRTLAAAIAALVTLAMCGCAVPPPVHAPFERCVATLVGNTAYAGERLQAAQWCASHDNGGIQR